MLKNIFYTFEYEQYLHNVYCIARIQKYNTLLGLYHIFIEKKYIFMHSRVQWREVLMTRHTCMYSNALQRTCRVVYTFCNL